MVDILELVCDVGREVYPAAYSQHRPALASNSMPPGQCSSSKKCHGHFDLFSDVYHTTYQAVLLQIEKPVGQLLGVPLELGWLIEFKLRSHFAYDHLRRSYLCHCGCCLHCSECCMPPPTYFSHHILNVLRCRVCCMCQCII